MSEMVSVAYLGPAGTFTEEAALYLQQRLEADSLQTSVKLVSYPSNAASLHAVVAGEVTWAVVPVENSVEGGVSATLDTCWQLDGIQIHHAHILPIRHALITQAREFQSIQTVYSHPQALGQCRQWLRNYLPTAEQIPANSNTVELSRIPTDPTVAVIASERAADLQQLPILACPINDYASNATRFWVVGTTPSPGGSLTSLAFSLPENVPGALLRPLQVFARRQLNMSRIESRPTKKSAGTYVFFIDIEHPQTTRLAPDVLDELLDITETLKIFGSYPFTAAAGIQLG